jgi:ABC-2 type transport system permease protein
VSAPSLAQVRRVAFLTIARKEIRRFLRIWTQTLVPPVITMSLYFVIFGKLIGARIGEMDGIRYIDFIAPGLIMMAVITNSYSNVVSSFFSARFQRYVEEMLVSPTPYWVMVTGYAAGGMARGLCVGFAVTLVSMFFADLRVYSVAVTLAVVVLTSTLFSMMGFINALFAKSFDDVSIVPTFVLTPLTYLGGVFYSIDLLPEPWHSLSLLNPILYMVNTFRYGILGVSDIAPWIGFSMIGTFTLALYGATLWLLGRGVGIRS